MNKGAHLARLFFSNECQRIEVFYFAGEFDRKTLGVEPLDIVRATAPVHQGGPRVWDSVANRCDEAEARNHDTTCQLRTPLIIANCQFPIGDFFAEIGNWQSAIGNSSTSCADRYSYTRPAHSGSFRRLRRESRSQTPLRNASRVR